MVQYGIFLREATFGFDLGTSQKFIRPVTDLLKLRIGASLQLAVASMAVALFISLPLGIYSAVRRGSRFQDPFSSLSPRMRVGKIIAEPIEVAGELPRRQVKSRVAEIMEQVGLDYEAHASLYPHEFSGGQRQRIAIALALSVRPRILVLDEPVSALDVSIRAQVMNLLFDLQREFDLTYIMISHDLSGVEYLSTRVMVMYLGRLVELSETEDIFQRPAHPYTEALLSAVPPPHPDIASKEIILEGEVPSPIDRPSGCHFHPRCPYVLPVCAESYPDARELGGDHRVACHLYPDHGGTDTYRDGADSRART